MSCDLLLALAARISTPFSNQYHGDRLWIIANHLAWEWTLSNRVSILLTFSYHFGSFFVFVSLKYRPNILVSTFDHCYRKDYQLCLFLIFTASPQYVRWVWRSIKILGMRAPLLFFSHTIVKTHCFDTESWQAINAQVRAPPPLPPPPLNLKLWNFFCAAKWRRQLYRRCAANKIYRYCFF